MAARHTLELIANRRGLLSLAITCTCGSIILLIEAHQKNYRADAGAGNGEVVLEVPPLFPAFHLFTNGLQVLFPLRQAANLNQDIGAHEVEYLRGQVAFACVHDSIVQVQEMTKGA